jgi:glycosyltransferase involved in cell wall biosynthesis
VLSRAAETGCMLAADAIVTLGEAMKRVIVERGVPEERITVIPNVVDTDRFAPGPREPGLAAELGIADDELVAGYISTFQEYEDLTSLVLAIGAVRRRGCKVRGVIVGEGQQRERLDRLLVERGLQDVITFTGRVAHSEVPRYHRLIDVFVVPRRAEFLTRTVTPLKPFEAMASGRPIVVSRLEALLEVVRDGETGRTFEPGDADGLADVLEELAVEPAVRLRLGRAARAWVVEERTLDENGRRYRALYERLGVA